jgi:STE24 endopeptidase
VLVVLQLAATPLENAISRHMEAEADWAALTATGDPGAVRDLFVEFTEESLVEPSPPTWAYVMLGTHPTIEQRIAMARAFERAQPGRTGQAGTASKRASQATP